MLDECFVGGANDIQNDRNSIFIIVSDKSLVSVCAVACQNSNVFVGNLRALDEGKLVQRQPLLDQVFAVFSLILLVHLINVSRILLHLLSCQRLAGLAPFRLALFPLVLVLAGRLLFRPGVLCLCLLRLLLIRKLHKARFRSGTLMVPVLGWRGGFLPRQADIAIQGLQAEVV